MIVTTKNGIKIEIMYSSKVNGPDQRIGGLSFGTTYLYLKTARGDWKITETRSLIKLKNKISKLNYDQLDEVLS